MLVLTETIQVFFFFLSKTIRVSINRNHSSCIRNLLKLESIISQGYNYKMESMIQYILIVTVQVILLQWMTEYYLLHKNSCMKARLHQPSLQSEMPVRLPQQDKIWFQTQLIIFHAQLSTVIRN